MTIVLGVDLGTTKITCIAVDIDAGQIIASSYATNDSNMTSPADQARGYSEWRADEILATGISCISQVTQQLELRVKEVQAIGITGQQHGVVLVDRTTRTPTSPLMNWQDRRALEKIPGQNVTWLQAAREAVGPDCWKETGCWLHPGFMAVTLFHQQRVNGQLPANSFALFIMDYFASSLTGSTPVTEPSCAGSSGLFDVRTRNWSENAIRALGLDRSIFPEIHEANHCVGGLAKEQARATGLPVGTPVFIAIGDHQASFLGSVSDRSSSVLVNVGTGAQVAVFTNAFDFELPIELRPCPLGGNLMSNVGLAGGWSYQLLEQFFQHIGNEFFDANSTGKIYQSMTRLAEGVAPGADGLVCEPRFTGTRLDPTVRGTFAGISPQNFTARHFARAVLEGMGRSLGDGFRAIHSITKAAPSSLIAAGNGLRENRLLARIVSQEFGLPITLTRHREEAAYGCALVASVASKIFPSVETAGKQLIKTEDETIGK